ncbi:Cell division protein FtsQ [Shimia sp. SK013]|uniref:cell division protein FtsQ/DivIB n=1 Tax=Shimia sp. SK013 TaxID=1389006 RepID=UPI0006B4C861|nr:cell division protein FtsQ/DivIB [Shimia sp. SK013]KPA23150.1 Cell division protein FtsQ [Shimia sp. SK013]
MRQVTGRADPAPSRWKYRMERLFLTPLFRLALRTVLPFALVSGATLWWLSDEGRREQLNLAVVEFRRELATRPEFMVKAMAIDGASEGTAEDIREILSLDFPVSSFDLELPQIQERAEELPAVAKVAVRVRPGGILQFNVVERTPIALWRTHHGLALVDIDGHVTAPMVAMLDHPTKPLIAGKGGDGHVAEAMKLFAAAKPLSERVIGLVRVGERRWDLVLDRQQRIQLPENGAVQALERVIALNGAHDMFDRDLMVVDMRLAARPTIRLTHNAIEEWWRISRISVGNN